MSDNGWREVHDQLDMKTNEKTTTMEFEVRLNRVIIIIARNEM